ncbi:hypothetical protein FUA48_06850 [Flavobacterium alkalisoli]|uniref:Lipoprotein n=1 Tax=Flavobacterium alkalisoli TaxID=2602769 RepID=A0A5B9FUJ3_9FLAO|nr:hypothetical protein [Flavobacterium alkalisoli]QEE49308.1 hypothetical protein FUA48_06850 [Flavobacterium alkalisoli]
MKTIKRLSLLYILAFAVSCSLFFINFNVVESSWEVKVFEVLTISFLLFVALTIIYFITQLIIKLVKAVQIKKPSQK